MIANMLEGDYRSVRLHHVPLRFSREIDEIGRPRVRKVLHILGTVARIVSTRVSKKAKILYYPPAGPNRVPIYRDIALLISTRWMFDTVIFHFHAGGLTDAYAGLRSIEKWLFRKAYYAPDIAIKVAEAAPDDPARLGASREFVVYNGVGDMARGQSSAPPPHEIAPRILFVGLVSESKGIAVLLESCRLLKRDGYRFSLDVVGKFESHTFEERMRAFVAREGLAAEVTWHGVLTGVDKTAVFRSASIFCFPTFYESETSGLVLLEAMQFAIPIVATRWRGIPSLVRDGHNGILVPTQNSSALAEALGDLLRDDRRLRTLGKNGRQLYEERFTMDAFHDGMERVFSEAAGATLRETKRS